jgi:hypothetical protein
MRASLDFQVFKKGSSEVLVASGHSVFHSRSVNAEVVLDAGEYVVHVRVDSEFAWSKVSGIVYDDANIITYPSNGRTTGPRMSHNGTRENWPRL